MVLNSSQKLLLAFVTLIIGVVLIGTISSNALAVTDKTRVVDETKSLTACYTGGLQVNASDSACNFTVTNVPSGWVLAEGISIESIVVKNGTKTALTSGTDYNAFPATGIIQFLNTTDTESFDGNNTYFDYAYTPSDYLNLGWGRTTLNTVTGFFALALLMVSVGLFFGVAKDYGII